VYAGCFLCSQEGCGSLLCSGESVSSAQKRICVGSFDCFILSRGLLEEIMLCSDLRCGLVELARTTVARSS
jgi:hypothetical protein